jgi:hypothetical protein
MRLNQLTQRANFNKYAVGLCLVALAALLCIQTFHTHLAPSSFADQTHCSVCVAAHSAISAMCVSLLLLVAPAPPRLRRSFLDFFCTPSQFLEFDLFSRPPPRR